VGSWRYIPEGDPVILEYNFNENGSGTLVAKETGTGITSTIPFNYILRYDMGNELTVFSAGSNIGETKVIEVSGDNLVVFKKSDLGFDRVEVLVKKEQKAWLDGITVEGPANLSKRLFGGKFILERVKN